MDMNTRITLHPPAAGKQVPVTCRSRQLHALSPEIAADHAPRHYPELAGARRPVTRSSEGAWKERACPPRRHIGSYSPRVKASRPPKRGAPAAHRTSPAPWPPPSMFVGEVDTVNGSHEGRGRWWPWGWRSRADQEASISRPCSMNSSARPMTPSCSTSRPRPTPRGLANCPAFEVLIPGSSQPSAPGRTPARPLSSRRRDRHNVPTPQNHTPRTRSAEDVPRRPVSTANPRR